MKTIELKGTKRETTGKKYSKKLRKEGKVPCVMYGGKENVHFYMPQLSFRNIVYTPNVYLLKFDVDGKNYDAVIRELQFHPVSDRLIHADFKEFSPDQPVIMEIPIKIVGESAGLKAGGKLRIRKRKLKVKGYTKDFPEFLEVDITKLKIGDTLRVEDLELKGLEILDASSSMVVSVISAKVISKAMLTAIEDIEAQKAELEEEKEAVEGEEIPEGEEAPEGEEPAEGEETEEGKGGEKEDEKKSEE